MNVSGEEELQLIFLEDSGTLEYSTCVLLQNLCMQCSLKIYCVDVYGVLVRRVYLLHIPFCTILWKMDFVDDVK